MSLRITRKSFWQGVHFGWFALGIFAIAMSVRGLHLWQIHSAPFFNMLMSDSQVYDSWAQKIAKGDWLGDEVFWHPPLYQYFLAVVYTIFSDDALVVRLCQAVIGSFSCVLLADAGRRFFSRSVGLIAGLTLALYAPAIFFDCIVHKTVLAFFFLALVLWFLSRLLASPGRLLSWFFVGVGIGCLTLVRENALVFVAAILIWLFVQHRGMGKRRVIFALVFAAGLLLVLMPVMVRNKIVGGEFHLTTSTFGVNLYYGNNAGSDGTYEPLRSIGRGLPMYEHHDATFLAEQAMGKKLTAGEVSSYWIGLAMDYIFSEPIDWVKLKLRTLRLAFNYIELVDTEGLYAYSDWSLPLRLTSYVFHFGVIAPAALFGFMATWKRRRDLWLLYLMLVIYVAGMVAFFVIGRYRHQMLAFLILFSSAGLVEFWSLLRSKSKLKLFGLVAVTIAMAVFCNWPMTAKQGQRSVTYSNIGDTYAKQGKLDDAIEYFNKALEITPGLASVHGGLGAVYGRQGKLDESVRHCNIALSLDPDFYEARYNLGYTLIQQGKLDEAVVHLTRAVEFLPDSAKVHRKLGFTLVRLGRIDPGIGHLQEAIYLESDHVVTLNTIAWLLATQRQSESYDPDEAVRLAERACELTGYKQPAMLDTLAVAYASAGRFAAAIESADKALKMAQTLGQQGLAEEIQRHLDLYKAGKSYGE